ncbi:MAG: hypothetical protein ACREXW_13550 [Gammaproteobacteria bacterium]
MKSGDWLGKRPGVGFIPVTAMALLIVSCATQPEPGAYDPPGFFSGVFHGFLILFSFIGSLFTDIRIYAFPNSGVWYDFGYLLGASMFLGCGGATTASAGDK